MGRDAEERRAERGGKGGIYSRRESSEALAFALYLIQWPLNLGGPTVQLRLLNISLQLYKIM
jgi:hypothetical protein